MRNRSVESDSVEQKLRKTEQLLELTILLHSTFDIEKVLYEVIKYIDNSYSAKELELWLTHEYFFPNLPIKQMSFIPTFNDIKGQAYLEGKVIFVEREELIEIAASLRGKQGVYGVLHFFVNTKSFNEKEFFYLEQIVSIAGIAFENAKLYENANQIVSELKIINEITTKLAQSLDIKSIVKTIVEQIEEHISCKYVGIAELINDQLLIIASNNQKLINENISLNNCILSSVIQQKEPIIISDNSIHEFSFQPIIKFRSLISLPIKNKEQIIGIIYVADPKPNFFSYEHYKLLQIISIQIGLAMTNAKLHENIQRMVITDYLTGLFSRKYMDEQIAHFQMKKGTGALLFFDIDHFKKINDTYGHQIGDEILIQVATIIKTSIRGNDFAARWGGEELAVYLPRTDLKTAKKIAERILNRVENETNPKVTISCGISVWSDRDEIISTKDLVKRADDALYLAKEHGRNRIEVNS